MVHARRKTPEELLREAESHEAAIKKGYLKIFLGYASGVGKSFRMLDEARRRRERGQDVVVGAVQPHAPPEVDRLLTKLEVIPLKPIGGGTAVDLEVLLARHPDVCFIDGLAYDNPPGSGNATRWEDAKELVKAGIKVIASINIQYVSELQEQIEAITGKQVTQTVPISFIKSADEIEIVGRRSGAGFHYRSRRTYGNQGWRIGADGLLRQLSHRHLQSGDPGSRSDTRAVSSGDSSRAKDDGEKREAGSSSQESGS
jgi:hypothetical protein